MKRTLVVSLFVALVGVASWMLTPAALAASTHFPGLGIFAVDLSVGGGANAAKGSDQPADLFGTGGIFNTISNVLLFIVGAVAVIMIVIGGLRYVISGGDSANVAAAKNTILYALVGVIVAILAYSVINFVISSFTGGGMNGGGGMTNV